MSDETRAALVELRDYLIEVRDEALKDRRSITLSVPYAHALGRWGVAEGALNWLLDILGQGELTDDPERSIA